MPPHTPRKRSRPHPTHCLRTSVDASSYDSICDLCGRTDSTPGGLGGLVEPCPVRESAAMTRAALSLAHRFEPDHVMIDEDPYYTPPTYLYEAVLDVLRELGLDAPG